MISLSLRRIVQIFGIFTLALFAGFTVLTGCGGANTSSSTSGGGGLTPTVKIAEPSATNIDAGDSVTLSATVTNDTNAEGVTWTLAGTGCTGSACGTLSNTTTTAATYTAPATVSSALTVTVTATSVAKSSATGTMELTVPVNPAISTASGALTTGMVGTAYSATLAGSGGITPYKWSLTQGTLPAGLILNGATGAISGTPTAAGNSSFAAELTDSGSAALTSTVNFSISIAAAPAIVFSTTSLANATLNTAYSADVAATGGSGALTYTLASGSLPTGLHLSSTGAITGTATTAATSTFTVKATDAYGDSGTSGSLSITVGYPALAITTSSLPGGVYKVAYAATLAATGGSGTGYSWSLVSGAFPAGVSLSAAGVISGTPTTTGSFSVKVQVADSASNTTTATLAFTVSYPALSITPTSLPAGIVGTGYLQPLSATGGSGTGYTYTVAAGTGLSGAGLSLSAAGVISGTPAASETSAAFTVQVTDSASNTATAQLALTIYPSLTVITTSLPAGTVGTSYSATLTASGGTGTGYTWTVTSGATSLSSIGLSLSSAGAITGTPTGPETAVGFTVTVTDSGSHTAVATLAITVNYPTLSITNSTLPGGTVNAPYSQTLSAQGGSGKGYTWTVTSGVSSLASINLSLSGAGVLSGTPAATGTATFTVKVTDSAANTATATYTITVYTGLTITTASLANGIVSQPYSASLLAAGGSGAGYTWIVKTGSLPAGLSLSTAGLISGSPTTAGTASFTIQVTDSASNTATASLAINVYSALTITTTILPSGTVSAAYSSTLHATGGSGTGYAWTVTSGASSLTAINLSLSGAGVLSGTSATTGSASFTVKVTDSASNTATASYTVTIYSTLTISTSSLPNAIVSHSYSSTLSASGGSGTGYAWIVKTGSLPAGLSLSSAGAITGSATTAGTVSFTVQVTDSVGNTATASLSINVYTQLSITSSTPPGITVNVGYSFSFAATGGSGGYTWSETGTLPSGITLTGGALSGTTTQTGSYPITVKVTDSATEIATASYTLVVSNALAISTSSLPNAIVSQSYSTTLAASGGSGTGYTWIVKTGNLPAGLSLSSAGVITGSATTVGNVNFTVQVTDSGSNTATASLAINVYNVLTIVTSSLPSGTVNTAYSQTLQANGGSGGYTWTVTSGASSLTALNLSLSGAGVLSGTPATAGSASFTVKVTDSASETATATLSVTINATLAITTSGLPNGTTGTSYSTALAAVGGTGTGYTWTLKSGGLPGGLGLSAAGAITGTPSSAGTANFTVQVTDSGSNFATANLSITVNGPLTLIYNGIPPATTNYPYSAQLGAAGGTGTGYLYSILSGAPPSGIIMNGSGQFSGTTTLTSGNFTFTVQVKDSGNNTASQAYTISVYSTLTIVSTGLPSGNIGQSYLTYILAAGGSGTGYVYSLTSGSLPPGLALTQQGNSGPITGTPTTAGTYNFTIGVTDSNSNTASASLSITINAPQPLTLQSDDNGNAEVGFLWSQHSYANGGSGPYTITVTSGTIPSWITISPAANCGTNCWSNVSQIWFTGTPGSGDVGTVNFTLQAADSSTPTAQTATQAYNFTVSAVDSSHNSELKGTYAFEIQGWQDGSNDGTTTQTAIVGSLVFDGNGNITSGEADQNGESSGYKEITGITGTYSVGANNLGVLVLNAGGGQNPTAIAVGGISGGIATKARIMQYTDVSGIGDPSGSSAGDAKRASGTMLLQTSADFTASALTGGYAFTLYGETPCPTCVSATTYGPITSAGVFSANGTGGITTGEEDVTTGSTGTSAMTLSGSYGTPDASGRVVASIAQSGYTIGVFPEDYVFYIVNAQTVFMMSTDSHATTSLLAGRALQQQVSSFTNNNLSGNSVLLISEPGGGYVSGFGTSSSSSSSNASVGLVTATPGTSQLTVTIQQNSGAQSQTLTYSVAANGRMTLSGGGGSSPVFYLVNTNQGFGTDLSSGGQHGGLLTMEPQIGASFSTSTLSGNYVYSNDTLIVPEMSGGIGVATVAGGNVTPTGDTSDADGTLFLNTPQGTVAYTVDSSTGLITLGGSGGSIGYIVSPSEVVFIDTSTGNQNPSVTILEQ